MDSDLDPFGDILPEPPLNHARAGAKFQPRAKPRPKKVITSASLPSIIATNSKEKSVSLFPTSSDATSVDAIDGRLTSPVNSSLASSALLGKGEQLANNHESLKCKPVISLTQPLTRSDDLASADALASELVVSNSKNGDSHLLMTETDSSQLDLDSFAGVVSGDPINKASVDSHTTPPVQSFDVVDKTMEFQSSDVVDKIMDPASPSLPNQVVESNEFLKGSEVLFPDDNSNLKSINLLSEELEPKDDMSARDDQAEADKMGLDLDPFADIIPPPSTSNARAGGKFQPRAKARPRKGTSERVSIATSNNIMKEHANLASTVSDNLQSAQVLTVGGGTLPHPVDSSLTTLEDFLSKEPLRNDDYKNSGVSLSNDDKSSGLENSSHLLATGMLHLDVATRDPQSGLGKSIGENTDIFSGLEYIHDFDTQSPTNIEIPVPASDEKGIEGELGFSAQDTLISSALRASNIVIQDPVSCNEVVIQDNNGRPELEAAGAFSNLETSDDFPEPNVASGCCTEKFLPQPNVQSGKEKHSVSTLTPDAVDSIAPPPNPELDPSEKVCMDEGPIPTFPSDDVLDYSSTSFNNFTSPDPTTSRFPMNEERVSFMEASHSSDPNVLHQEDLSGETAKEGSKGRKRKSSSVSNHSQKFGHSSVVDEIGGIGISPRQLRKRTAAPQLVDEPEDEAHDVDGFPSKASSNSIAEEEDDDYDYRVDEDNDTEDRAKSASCEKRDSKKPKKPAADKGKTGRRRKRDNDASEQSNQEPRKKFSHSTRRKNRLKDLLSIPEDEIDFQRLPVRDVILLAGYKERLAIKEAKASKDASTNQSSVNSLHGEDSHNEEDTVTSEQDGGYTNDQSNPLFNYHSFMERTPTARWSKQDTELFYEGIQQFGTDLSMIQQLFPGRTRHQIKLKYKKEERQHPLRLSEALSNRAKDHSHFEKVIEQLQQFASQAEQESNRDASAGVTDEEAELNLETNEEPTKLDRDENATVEDQDEAHNPSKCEEDEDDLDIWSSYKSVF